MGYFAVIDTETNWVDQVMSIGTVVADGDTMEAVEARYHILPMECEVGGMYESTLFIETPVKPVLCTRAEALTELLNNMGNPLNAFVKLEVPQDVLMARMLRRAAIENRADDTEEVILNRFKEYEAKTLPVFDYFKKQNICFEIEAIATPD